jgi:hypothetical protein
MSDPASTQRAVFNHGHNTHGPEIQHLQAKDVFALPAGVSGVRVEVEWHTPHSGLADLDVYVMLYDENVSQ